MCGQNTISEELFHVSKESCLKEQISKTVMRDSKTEESLERALRSVEDLSFEKLTSEVANLLKLQYLTVGTERSIHQIFERYLICIFQMKREVLRLGRSQFPHESILSLECKVFYEYFPMISLQEKVEVASRILQARVLYELHPSTIISLLEQGVDVSKTKDCFRTGLLIWEGSWLHQLVAKGLVLRREWFADSDSTCGCAQERITESILDHAMHAETALNVKVYNIVLSIAMGCNLLNADIDSELVPVLSWSVHNVALTQQFALSHLRNKLPSDIVDLVGCYYSSDLTKLAKVLEVARKETF